MEDISIIVANFNNGKFLDDFMESIIQSTVLPRELILVDDGSTDDSLVILEKYRHLDFLKVLISDKNYGNPAAVNRGLEIAGCKYIMRADPDDIIALDRIEKQYNFLESHPEIDVLGSNVLYFSGNKKILNISNLPLTHEKIVKTYQKGEHGVLQATTMIKSEVYQQYRYKNIFPGEDYDLFSRMVKDGRRFHNLAEPLYKVRVHPGSSTNTLKFETIRQTFRSRDSIFGTHTSALYAYIYYIHIKYYRAFQSEDNRVKKYLYLLISSLASPKKVIRRIFSA
ncbi:MAG: glycosyltransferase [Bacteroidales bacterium]